MNRSIFYMRKSKSHFQIFQIQDSQLCCDVYAVVIPRGLCARLYYIIRNSVYVTMCTWIPFSKLIFEFYTMWATDLRDQTHM